MPSAIGRKLRIRMASIERTAVTLSAALVPVGLGKPFERRCVIAMAIETPAVGNGLVNILTRESFHAVAGITQVR